MSFETLKGSFSRVTGMFSTSHSTASATETKMPIPAGAPLRGFYAEDRAEGDRMMSNIGMGTLVMLGTTIAYIGFAPLAVAPATIAHIHLGIGGGLLFTCGAVFARTWSKDAALDPSDGTLPEVEKSPYDQPFINFTYLTSSPYVLIPASLGIFYVIYKISRLALSVLSLNNIGYVIFGATALSMLMGSGEVAIEQCSQGIKVIRQCYDENIKPTLEKFTIDYKSEIALLKAGILYGLVGFVAMTVIVAVGIMISKGMPVIAITKELAPVFAGTMFLVGGYYIYASRTALTKLHQKVQLFSFDQKTKDLSIKVGFLLSGVFGFAFVAAVPYGTIPFIASPLAMNVSIFTGSGVASSSLYFFTARMIDDMVMRKYKKRDLNGIFDQVRLDLKGPLSNTGSGSTVTSATSAEVI